MLSRSGRALLALALLLVTFACANKHKGATSAVPRRELGSPRSQLRSKSLDEDAAYPYATEVLYLSGKGSDDAVPWDFMVSSGRQAGVWGSLPVPSNWEMFGFGTLAYGFNPSNEVGTYRRSFELPKRFSGKRVRIVFEGALTDTRVTVNGKSAGPVHQGGFYRFAYDITELLRPGRNELEVVVAEQSGDASVNAAEREADYWTFGGIFRPVYLEAYPHEAIASVAIHARADGRLSADVGLRGVSATSKLTGRVFDEQLREVGGPLSVVVAAGAANVTLVGEFSGIVPWSAEAPVRYRLALELEAADGRRHQVRENFGFRTLEVRAGDGLYVNGRRITLRGVNRASFWPDSGRALSPALSRADVRAIKDMNMNAVRSSHYPPDRHFLDTADREGLYVLDELAGWQTPPYDTKVGRQLVEEMVRFDVNHPSILFWDNGNEGGWNTELDGEFARHDPQRRPVLHPWAKFSDIDTDHYESYESTRRILGGPTLFMPTEMLHGLYDGGGGAGLDDYWRAFRDSPRGAGVFLWCFADEGVRLPSGEIDTAGASAPDGILGPYRQKEGSYYTVRDIWSPVQLLTRQIDSNFDGSIEVENRYDETDLSRVLFQFELVRFDFESPRGGHHVVAQGTARTGSIPPRRRGALHLALPGGVRQAHALLLHAQDAKRRSVGDWSFMLVTPAAIARELLSRSASAPALTASADADTFGVTRGDTSFTFSKSTAQLLRVEQAGRLFPLGQGPTLSVGTSTLSNLNAAFEGEDFVLRATFGGDLREIIWRVRGNGWLSLDYRYSLTGSFDFYGIDFDCTEEQVEAATWLGLGPSRVWKNRLRGTWHDLWYRARNDAVTGERWDYPEFKGYFGDFHYLKLTTKMGPIQVLAGSPGLYLRLFTPQNGAKPMAATMKFPARALSILHAIAPIGDKFLSPAELGPQGAPNVANGELSGTIHLRFGG